MCRFRNCNVPELEFWHVADWTRNLRFGFRIGVYSAFLEKTKSEVFAHSHVFSTGIYGFTVFRAFSVSALACNSPALLPWLSSALVSLSLYGFLGGWGGVGGDVNVHGDAACDVLICFASHFRLPSWGGGEGEWGDVNVHGDAACDTR